MIRDEDEEDDDDEGFVVLEQDVRALSEIDHEIEQLKLKGHEGEDEDERIQSDGEKKCQSDAKEENTMCKKLSRKEIVEELFQLKSEFSHWTEIRATTIKHLREIADYIDTVSRRTGIAKVVGSGGGAVGGGLTLVGGLLTIMSAGAALPVLLVGTGIGLASGVTGGAAAITEKIIKSKQMKAAEAALSADESATQHLEEKVTKLRENRVVKEVARDLLKGGACATTDSIYIAGLVSSGGASTFGKIGGEAVAKIFGEDVGKEISKLVLHTSGRLLSGSVTVVLGGVTMLYDIYKLNNEVQEIAKLGSEGASEIRTIADHLEKTLGELCQG